MRLDCPRCGRTLEYTDRRPAFCAYCGKPLSVPLESTDSLEPEEATLPPTAPAPLPRSSLPRCIGGYRLLRTLGTGGMGTVYEAEEDGTGRRVALKLISPEYAGSQETVARFRQEGRLASQIVHPRCVFVHKADEEAGLPYIVMELMPGATLQDLVLEKGPLAQEDAVAKILDVIDGLQEAHRLGIVHRDVKPSNCFLEADGRVKVGDFGLSRSLLSDARLTRAGAFLGTPLYAAPEQIRADAVDQQSDVYSVAATLYFLLVGRAPHQTGDAAATMARIVSEPPPPLCEERPELSPALDEVVLRGLERDRGRRWASLAEFREALLPFAPGRLPAAGRMVRFAAFVFDFNLLNLLDFVLTQLYIWALTGSPWNFTAPIDAPALWFVLLIDTVWIGYFGLLEGRWGATLGKMLFRIRVTKTDQSDPPGVPRALLRAVVLILLLFPSWHLGPFLGFLWWAPEGPGATLLDSLSRWWVLTLLGANLLGLVALLGTMRMRNGLRGLHELASGTRVLSLVSPERRLVLPVRHLEQEVTQHVGLPEQLGPFALVGLLAETPNEKVLLGQDPSVGRKAVVWLRLAHATPVSPARQALTRGSRLRWLASGTHCGEQWDAFVAPAGCALTDLTARDGRLAWADVRLLLEQLTDELATARADRTLPDVLCTDQVWVQPDSRVCLLEFPLCPHGSLPAVLDDREPALPLLRETALLALEGRPRQKEDRERRVRAPLPKSVAEALGRLFGEGSLEDFRADLTALSERSARVTAAARLTHLEVLTLLLFFGLLFMVMATTVPLYHRTILLAETARDHEQAASILKADAQAAAAAATNPDPLLALIAVEQVRDWLSRAEAREIDGRRRRQAFEAHLHGFSLPTQWFIQAQLAEEEGHAESVPYWLPAYRMGQMSVVSWEEDLELENERKLVYAWICFFPAVWVVWAFLFRGGISYRLTGLALVRSDGRPAARWQCGLRALLVWAPIVSLICFSVWLGTWYVMMYVGGNAYAWVPWLSLTSWWLAVLLLPGFALLAWWSPERALHDRMVGTYLVPR